MIGTACVYRDERKICVDATEVRPYEIPLCPVCGVRGLTKYDSKTDSVIFVSDKHNNEICKAMAKTKSIKRIRDVNGAELIENLFSANPIMRSRSKVLTLADVHAVGLHKALPDTKIKDGVISEFLLTHNFSLPILRDNKTIGRRIIRAKLDFFDPKTQSIILIAAWPQKGNSKQKFNSKRLRLYFHCLKDFCAIRNELIKYKMDERRFAKEVHYKGDLLVAGNWVAESDRYCRWYCSKDCDRTWQCHGMFTAEDIKLSQIIKIEGDEKFE